MKKLQAIKLAAAALSVVISSVAFGYGTYEIDKVHSAINFKALHMNAGYTWGRFKDFGGKFTVDEKKPENSKIEIEVMANSIDTLDAKRDDHVRGPDFLNTKEFQKITFTSKKIVKAGNDYKVTGVLGFNGQKRDITVDVKYVGMGKDPWGFQRFGFETVLPISLKDFKVKGVDGVGDKVELPISIEGSRKI